MTTNALTVTESLTKTTQRSSLDELATARTKRSLLLVDVSGSMDHRTSEGLRKVDQLRNVVRDLLETHPVPVAACSDGVRLVGDHIPEPSGSTRLDSAI